MAKDKHKPRAGESAAQDSWQSDDSEQTASASTAAFGHRTTSGVLPTRKASMPAVRWKYVIFGCIGAMFLALATHLLSMNGGLVLNDRATLSYLFSQETTNQMAERVSSDMVTRPLSQPWTKISFLSDKGDWGSQFAFFHCANVFMHMFAVVYLFLFVVRLARHLYFQRRLTADPYYLAIGAAGVFACHPMATETVCYLSCRSALLGTVNYLLCINCFLFGLLGKHPLTKICGYLLALIAGGMALMSNPECVTLPAALLLVAALIRGPLKDGAAAFKQNPFAISVTLVAALACPFLLLLGAEFTEAIALYSPVATPSAYIASQLKAIPLYYLRCLVLPLGLSIDPPLAEASGFGDPLVWLGAVVLVALCALSWRFKREPALGIGFLLLTVGFLPHAMLVQRELAADWVCYLPLAGAAVFWGFAFAKIAEHNLRRGIAIFASVLLLFAGLSIWRDLQWGADLQLAKSALDCRPKSTRAHALSAIALVKLKRVDEAKQHADLAVAYGPETCLARIAEGRVHLAKDEVKKAEDSFGAALNLAKVQRLPQAAVNECLFGLLESQILQNRVDEGQATFRQLLIHAANDPRTFLPIALASFRSGQYARAYQVLTMARKSDPYLLETYELGAQVALTAGDFERAYADAKAWQTLADAREAKRFLARMAIKTRRLKEARDLLLELKSTDSRDARTLLVLSNLYKAEGNLAEADKCRQDALKLEPTIEETFLMSEGEPEPPANQVDPHEPLKGVTETRPSGAATAPAAENGSAKEKDGSKAP